MRYAAVGFAMVAAHAALLPLAVTTCRRDGLRVDLVVGAPAAQELALFGEVPASIKPDVTIADDGGPGLHRRRWSIAYRGGFASAVGAAQLVGPFQDPAAPPCSGRVIVGQALLDDGAAGPGTIAAIVVRELGVSLAGMSAFPIGKYQRVRSLSLSWNRAEATPADRGIVDARRAPNGYVRAHAVVAFTRADVPVTVVMIPALVDGKLRFEIKAGAKLDWGNRVIQWASDLVGGDKFATSIAQDEIDELLVTVLEPPPPVELPGGRRIVFDYCGAPPVIAHGSHAALPVAVSITGLAADPLILPPLFGPAPAPPPPATTRLALDLDLDALNALLYELWRTGMLDEQLAAAGLHDRFNADPIVTGFLSVRISPLRLALPPVLTATGDRLRMAGDLAVTIADGARTLRGRVWSRLDFRFGPAPGVRAAVDVGDLELSCEPAPQRLVPCYGDLVGAIRDRAPEVHETLTATFTGILDDIFVGQRISDPKLPAELVVTAVTPSAFFAPPNGKLRLDLAATIEPR
jgi:hypothetical protein